MKLKPERAAAVLLTWMTPSAVLMLLEPGGNVLLQIARGSALGTWYLLLMWAVVRWVGAAKERLQK